MIDFLVTCLCQALILLLAGASAAALAALALLRYRAGVMHDAGGTTS